MLTFFLDLHTNRQELKRIAEHIGLEGEAYTKFMEAMACLEVEAAVFPETGDVVLRRIRSNTSRNEELHENI